MPFTREQVYKMVTNPKVTLYDSTRVIGDYIIKNKLLHDTVFDVLTVLVDMGDTHTFLFADDMWPAVAENTIAYIDQQNNFLDKCIEVLNKRKKPLRLAQERIHELAGVLYSYTYDERPPAYK